jgi:putative Mg2+ transporter-C (MgtC) family protein
LTPCGARRMLEQSSNSIPFKPGSRCLLAALITGCLIGLERSYHGRPAGFRTPALVCLSTSLFMLVTVYESALVRVLRARARGDRPDPHVAGNHEGIGFLGAGAIMQEGLSVRGLTTAASIWITAAIGILIGVGFDFPAAVAAALTLGTLSAFRWIEAHIPAQFYAHFYVRFARDAVVAEGELRRLVTSHGFPSRTSATAWTPWTNTSNTGW